MKIRFLADVLGKGQMDFSGLSAGNYISITGTSRATAAIGRIHYVVVKGLFWRTTTFLSGEAFLQNAYMLDSKKRDPPLVSPAYLIVKILLCSPNRLCLNAKFVYAKAHLFPA